MHYVLSGPWQAIAVMAYGIEPVQLKVVLAFLAQKLLLLGTLNYSKYLQNC